MPVYIVKLRDGELGKDWYLEWSTIVDAPITGGMARDEFAEYYRRQYGERGMVDLAARMARVDAKGTSSHLHRSAEDCVSFNRAGKGETRLTINQIVAMYCRGDDAPEIEGKPWSDE